ncbi:ThiF family adenylyltransferase [Amycolatopsis sp. lyj-346]|uniref:ThiF family adenylyltransferase n=1 Tax=Amycolatopsis sp. lyj-346 TaxID=2789289 RepID=UPI00397CCF31
MAKPRLKPSHPVIRTAAGDIVIGKLARNSYVVRDAPQAFVDLLQLLDGSRTTAQLAEALRADEDQVRRLVERLAEAGLLDDGVGASTLSGVELERYDRQLLQFSAYERDSLPGFAYQERLRAQRVCLLGMGGWGSWLALNLALTGFGTLRLVDGDRVELSNLGRQVLYDASSVGRLKVTAARDALRRINPHVDIEEVPEFVRPDRVQVERVLADATLVCLCWSDGAHFVPGTAGEIVHDVAVQLHIPVLEIAADPFDVTVGPLYPNDGTGPCFRCVRPQLQTLWWGASTTTSELRKAQMSVSPLRRTENAQNAPSLSAMAGLAVNDLMAFATGYAEPALLGRRFGVALRTLETRIDEFESRPGCCDTTVGPR